MRTAETISEVISQFAGVIEATRAELATVRSEIEAAEAERREIVLAKPHTDDIVAAFKRGLSGRVASFEKQLSTYFTATFVKADSAADTAARQASDLLCLEVNRPDFAVIEKRRANGDSAPLNLDVIAYLLSDKLEAEIPALVDKLCPAAREGMNQADRSAALAAIDARILVLTAKRDALAAELDQARRVAGASSAGFGA